jgi:hypothetical protein
MSAALEAFHDAFIAKMLYLLRRDCGSNAVDISGAEVDEAVRDGDEARISVDNTLVVELSAHTHTSTWFKAVILQREWQFWQK